MTPNGLPSEAPLPTALRRVTFCALVLSGMLGFGAAQSLTQLFDPPAPSDLDFSGLKPVPGLESQPDLYREAVKSMALAQLAAYDSMRGSRTAILIGLWAVSALVFVSALRMLRPRGAPREGVRRVLGTSMLLCAVLRTLDGAQSAAAATRAGRAFDKVLAKSTEIPGGWPEGLWANAYTGLMIFITFVVGGCLMLMARYYRSDRVRELTTGLDASAPK